MSTGRNDRFGSASNGARIMFPGDSQVYVKYGTRAVPEVNTYERFGNGLDESVVILGGSNPPGLTILPRSQCRAERAILRTLAQQPFDPVGTSILLSSVREADRPQFKAALQRLITVRLVGIADGDPRLTGYGLRRAGAEGFIRLG